MCPQQYYEAVFQLKKNNKTKQNKTEKQKELVLTISILFRKNTLIAAWYTFHGKKKR